MEEQNWLQQITRISSDKSLFNRVISRAEQDIYLLLQSFGKHKTVSAGVPWFSTLFGRDSIITASQTLMLNSKIAKETLILLAEYQGQTDNIWREEEPGKILHELRLGEMARCQEIPHTPYYGTVDATPLWLMLYAEYYSWTHDQETLEALWPNALAAKNVFNSRPNAIMLNINFKKRSFLINLNNSFTRCLLEGSSGGPRLLQSVGRKRSRRLLRLFLTIF
jgi:glycogen debranching enzyme